MINIRPRGVAKILKSMLEKCKIAASVTIHPDGALSWRNEPAADTSVEIDNRTAVIVGYDDQLQAVKIVDGEYKDLGFTSRSPQKVSHRAISAYVEMALREYKTDG